MKSTVIATALVLVAGLGLAADTVTLKDGKVITGTILEQTDSDIQIATETETIRIPRWAIDKIEPEAGAAGSADAEAGDKRSGPTGTPALLQWVDLCIARLSSDDPGVRISASAALRAAGEPARPALEKAAAGDDEKVASLARKLLGAPGERRAQVRRSADEGSERRVPVGRDALLESLELTEEQSTKVAAIFDGLREKQLAVAESVRGGEMDRQQAKDKLFTLRVELDEKLAEILTEEQLVRYREMRPTRSADN